MKEKLHKELNRIAKHILAANDSSEISSLYEAARSLYEKLTVLKFIERELEDPALDLEQNVVADKFQEMAAEVLSANELVPENNPHPTDIMTPGMDTINHMVSEMPLEKTNYKPWKETKNTTVNGQFGAALNFGLNDKIAFVKHLFNGDENDFKRVISQLNTIETEERAFSFITNLVKPEYGHWEGKEVYEKRFMLLIQQKYN